MAHRSGKKPRKQQPDPNTPHTRQQPGTGGGKPAQPPTNKKPDVPRTTHK